MYRPEITVTRSWGNPISFNRKYKILKYFWTSLGFSPMISAHFVESVLEKGVLKFFGDMYPKATITVGTATGWKEKEL